MLSIVILADDLTGAADSAARCCGAGLPALISRRPPRPPLPAGVLALTSESRYLPAPLAAQRVGELLAGLRGLANVRWYKKIDSTLRGNIGAELDIMLNTLGRSHAIIAPAFPAQGRGLLQGLLVGEQIAASPPAHLPSLLQKQASGPVAAVALDEVRAGVAPLTLLLRDLAAHNQLIVVDALSDDDLHTLVVAAAHALPEALLCGSAGFVGALAAHQARDLAMAATSMPSLGDHGHNGPALVVVGSGSIRAQEQIAFARAHSQIEVVEVGAASQPTFAGDMLLHLPTPPPGTTFDTADGRALAERIAAAAHEATLLLDPALLVLVGGDTAACSLEALGIGELLVLRELLPGMPLAQATDSLGRTRLVILKAGNHGDAATLPTLLRLARGAFP